MLLRRITEHVKAQNWTAVGLDFAIVVLGVFIGLQVANWNDDRKDQILEQEYLHRLHADMELSIARTERTRSFVADNTARLGLVLDRLEKCELAEEDRDKFANGLNHAGKLIPATFVRGTLDELLSSGRIGLITNTQIRDRLNEAIREMAYLEGVWSSMNARLRGLFHYVDEKAVIRIADEERRHGFGSAKWEELEMDFAALCNDQKFRAAVNLPERLGYVNIDWLDRNLENFRAARDAIADEIEPTTAD